ncbi:flagellin [Cellulomonas endophytica]|uniref:flagellin N-terminal helical domain-containing protein n=1 Tax=Cellulomonas endophytica TaxID=2494735 RepID=UPI001F0CADBF|nr:flagellin [Cellulomonas endophytica]
MTHQSIQRSSLGHLQTNLQRMSDLQAKLSRGTTVGVPSDDPAATSDILALDRQTARTAQYQRNAQDATTWLNVADSTLQQSVTATTRARTLLVQAGDGALGREQLGSIATELEGLRETLLAQANTSVNGRTVFAGASDAGVAFDAATYAYRGRAADGSVTPVERRLAEAVTVRVDGDGAAAYGEGADSVFAVLDAAAAALRSGNPDIGALLGTVDGRLAALQSANAAVGARQKQVEVAQESLADQALSTKTQLSSVQDIDLASVVLDLQSQEVAYKSALSATARTLQPSLLEFLR